MPRHSLLHNPLKSMYRNSNDTRMQLNTTRAYVQSNGATTMDTCYTNLSEKNTASHIQSIRKPRSMLEGQELVPSCMLPIVNSLVKNGAVQVSATTLLDSGSELHIMNTKLYKQLSLNGSTISLNIVGVGGQILQRQVPKVEVVIVDQHGNETTIECVVLENTCGRAISIPGDVINHLLNDINICKENFVYTSRDVDLLIGMATPQLHHQTYLYEHTDGLSVMGTRFGPCIIGPVPENHSPNYAGSLYNSNQVYIENNELIDKRFVGSEVAGIIKECSCQDKSDEEFLFDKAMETAWNQDETWRYEVRLPWKLEPSLLENNREQAEARDQQLSRGLLKDPTIKKLFDDQIDEMIASNILVDANPSDVKRYLPLLAVINLDRNSSKVCVCLDSKVTYKGLSLNDAF